MTSPWDQRQRRGFQTSSSPVYWAHFYIGIEMSTRDDSVQELLIDLPYISSAGNSQGVLKVPKCAFDGGF
jgi:hypothetical protein